MSDDQVINGATVELDMGADRDTRVVLCTKTAWCVEPRDHEGPCVEAPRLPHPAPVYRRGRKK